MSDDSERILNKLEQVSERMIRMETQITDIKEDIKFIKEEDRQQNELLAEHIAGVKTNKERLDNEIVARAEQITKLDSRIGTLEEVPKFLGSFKKVILYIAAVAGAILTITKFMDLW